MTEAIALVGCLWGIGAASLASTEDVVVEPAPVVTEATAPPDASSPDAPPPDAPPPEGTPPPEGVEPPTDIPVDGPPEESTPSAEPEPEAPAPLPSHPPAPPGEAEPQAWGGVAHTPLPRPPDPADPSTLVSAPWRGHFWLGIALHASIPVAGRAPARGGVISAAGEITLGWRPQRFLALHTSISTFAHDAALTVVTNDDGAQTEGVSYGRITAFDLLTARVFLPRPRRVEPWAELGAGVGLRRSPLGNSPARAAGLARLGLGVDFWLAPAFTLGISTAYRLTIIGDAVGHGLRAGADLGIHW